MGRASKIVTKVLKGTILAITAAFITGLGYVGYKFYKAEPEKENNPDGFHKVVLFDVSRTPVISEKISGKDTIRDTVSYKDYWVKTIFPESKDKEMEKLEVDSATANEAHKNQYRRTRFFEITKKGNRIIEARKMTDTAEIGKFKRANGAKIEKTAEEYPGSGRW